MLRFWLLLAVFFDPVAAAQAESARLQRLDTGDDNQGWESVGRLELGDGAFCTATLIAPDLILTAAHCLFDQNTGERIDPANIRFLAGWRNGRATAYAKIRNAAVHPEYDFAEEEMLIKVKRDLALLRLFQPIRKPNVLPFETALPPGVGHSVGVVSYAHDRSEAPSLQKECDVIGRQHGFLIMSCLVDFGSSGAPVFSFSDDEAKIVSVVSVKAVVDDKPVSLGAELGTLLDELRAHLEESVTGPKFERTSE